LSVAVPPAAIYAARLEYAAGTSFIQLTVIVEGQLIVGTWLSETFTIWVHVVESPFTSVTVHVTVVDPIGN
jgi:valyl-tRNA synthetase